MWPAIIAALLLHRIRRAKVAFFLEAAFVVPMVIPGLVWLLIWKGALDPSLGAVDAFLNTTGLMELLRQWDAVMPQISAELHVLSCGCDMLFAGSWNMWSQAEPDVVGNGFWGLLLLGALIWMTSVGRDVFRKHSLMVMLVSVSALCVWREKFFYLLPMFLLVLAWCRKRGFMKSEKTVLRKAGWGVMGASLLLIFLSQSWPKPTGAFLNGSPAWLSDGNLVIAAILFWGFPWLHATGALIYLAGLRRINREVYEAAKLDGAGEWETVFKIELPMLLSQVRLNLVFMTIATLNAYPFFLVLLGPEGGPGGKATVPGLYIYQEAFLNGQYGYACALGVILFLAILLLTFVWEQSVQRAK